MAMRNDDAIKRGRIKPGFFQSFPHLLARRPASASKAEPLPSIRKAFPELPLARGVIFIYYSRFVLPVAQGPQNIAATSSCQE